MDMSELVYSINDINMECDDLIDKFSSMKIKAKKEKILNFHLFYFNSSTRNIKFVNKHIGKHSSKNNVKCMRNISYMLFNLIQYNWNNTTVVPYDFPVNKRSVKKIVKDFVNPSVKGEIIFGNDDAELMVAETIRNGDFCVNIINKLDVKSETITKFKVYSIAICVFDKPSNIPVTNNFTLLSNIDNCSANKNNLKPDRIIIKNANLINGILYNHNYLPYEITLPIHINYSGLKNININVTLKLELLLRKLSEVLPEVNIIKMLYLNKSFK